VGRRDLAILVSALRRPLLDRSTVRADPAAADEGPELGRRLRAACDDLVAAGALPPERVGPMRAWRRRLERFEALDGNERRIELARGLRLCAALASGVELVPDPPPAALPEPPTREPTDPLAAGAASLPGIGKALAERLADAGLSTIEDLAWHVPRKYDDLRHVAPLAAIAAGVGERVTFVAAVRRARFSRFRRRYLEVQLEDGDVHLVARWFNVHGGMARRFAAGDRVILSGILREHAGTWTVANPDVLGSPDDETTAARAAIRPRYPEVEGVAPAILRRACREAAGRAGPHLVDGVPRETARRLDLPGLAASLEALHAPPRELGEEELAALCRGESVWHRRLAFDELFFLALAVARRRAERDAAAAPPCPVAGAVEGVLPFALTGAQRRAIATIVAELARERPMNRLLQGDVGSGKTAVAFAAAQAAMASGRQVAVMAPTELLAEQHMTTLGTWAAAAGRRAALLTASTPRGARESTLGMLAAGALDLVIGTHALLSDRIELANLGLAIIDEQHRFGVAQRVRLRAGPLAPGPRSPSREILPHLLVMTATPIPRSLALTIYGDLDVTTLDELPPGRAPPRTRVLRGERGRRTAYQILSRVVDSGGRAFVVCPLVAPSKDTDETEAWADAVTTAARLAAELAPRRVGLAHGRMSAAERDAAMRGLRSGALDVLVATTIVEVGVDVPAARVMVVEDADRFGLAQLHQLRGRVGRGGGDSHCLLLCRGARTADAARRLAIMEETCDGFRIAEEDLAIRGPGEILGVRQAGLPRLRFADLVAHASLAAEARREAERLLRDDPMLSDHPLAARILETRTRPDAVTAEGG
jgi:ATP-dependent DNA helicase RecG